MISTLIQETCLDLLGRWHPSRILYRRRNDIHCERCGKDLVTGSGFSEEVEDAVGDQLSSGIIEIRHLRTLKEQLVPAMELYCFDCGCTLRGYLEERYYD